MTPPLAEPNAFKAPGGPDRAMTAFDNGMDVVIEALAKNDDTTFREFLDTPGRFAALVRIARWGKENPSLWDKILFRVAPTRYADKAFR